MEGKKVAFKEGRQLMWSLSTCQKLGWKLDTLSLLKGWASSHCPGTEQPTSSPGRSAEPSPRMLMGSGGGEKGCDPGEAAWHGDATQG